MAIKVKVFACDRCGREIDDEEVIRSRINVYYKNINKMPKSIVQDYCSSECQQLSKRDSVLAGRDWWNNIRNDEIRYMRRQLAHLVRDIKNAFPSHTVHIPEDPDMIELTLRNLKRILKP